ncbi:amidophosphoribosyltransferase [Candidatus Kaiserbacteria bacterium]|nr:amidophosphoribosyltransferase [Candidatus Kaiserbacteria bacterium]
MADIGEKCAVFGVYGKRLEVARLAFFGLFALQHRGQESSGIATADGGKLYVHRGMGLVAQVYNEEDIKKMPGHISVGHNRYSTAGGSKVEHAQPMMDTKERFALAHNGNLPSTTALWNYLQESRESDKEDSDTRFIVNALASAMDQGDSLEEAVKRIYPLMTGAFSILIMGTDRLIAIRDRCGIRPLSMAKVGGGIAFSSETCALHTIDAEFLRDVAPGEMIVVDESGVHSEQLAPADPKFDVFEFVYFSRPDSELLGKSVYGVRKNFGKKLAQERKINADVVIPVPETSNPVAIGYSQASLIPMELGLAKNRYIHRTFIQPEQHMREQGVKMKLSPVPEVIKGKRVIVVDDSIVRGTTSRQIVEMLFETGAKEVHFVVSSPPVRFPDFYGIDTPRQDQLIAAMKSEDEVQQYLKATSLQYLSLKGMIDSIGVPESQLNTSCFTGKYPIDIGHNAKKIMFDARG